MRYKRKRKKEKRRQKTSRYSTCIHRENSRPIPSIRIHERPGFERKKKKKKKEVEARGG